MNKQIPKGLVFSTEDPVRRKRAIILSVILVIVQISLIWPVYPLFASPTPLIFGFPLSVVWVIAMLLTGAISVFIFFLKDKDPEC
ncbi:hypothetical protein AB2B38_002570 [Balneola sp. MJW-20]|uniref:hypothetical protein n=1 Tax=Gracilimonas aurantiaca TaxID=3234185 RepID=UPI0034668306